MLFHQYLRRKLGELTTVYNDIHEMRLAKEAENEELEREVGHLTAMVERNSAECQEAAEEEAHERPLRMHRVVQRNQMVRKIKEQHELLVSLQEQLDTYMYRSFPSLG